MDGRGVKGVGVIREGEFLHRWTGWIGLGILDWGIGRAAGRCGWVGLTGAVGYNGGGNWAPAGNSRF